MIATAANRPAMTVESSPSSALHLPPDQRAVLEMVLRHGRDYGDIARLLSVDRAAVRQRALSAVDALSPAPLIAGSRRALIADYLLGQASPRLSADTRRRLAASASERAWARRVASALELLSSEPLPEIPGSLAEPIPPLVSPAWPQRIARSARVLRDRPPAITVDSPDLEERGQRRGKVRRRGYPTVPLMVDAVEASATPQSPPGARSPA